MSPRLVALGTFMSPGLLALGTFMSLGLPVLVARARRFRCDIWIHFPLLSPQNRNICLWELGGGGGQLLCIFELLFLFIFIFQIMPQAFLLSTVN